MPGRKLTKTRRNLPHWDLAGSVYFITFRINQGEMHHAEREIVLDHLIAGDTTFYRLIAAVVMPDHAHLILRPNEGYALSRVLQGIKGVSAKLINENRGTRGTFWQDEYHDRILRTEDEMIQKARYLLENPLRAGLIKPGQTYPYVIDNLSREG